MEQLLERVGGVAAKAVLTREEKDAMRRILQDRMSGPVPFAVRVQAAASDFAASLRRAFSVAPAFGRPAMTFAVVALFVSVSGGVVLAAEGSLPGDALYGLKTGFTEPVYGALSLTKESQARWQVRLVERRLQEAEKMAAVGRLNGPKQADLEQILLKQTQTAVRQVEELGQEGNSKKDEAVRLSSDLESSLRGHGERLGRILNADQAGDRAAAASLTTKAAGQAAVARAREEKSVTADQTGLRRRAENAASAAERKIKSVRNLLAADAGKISAGDLASAEAKLAEAGKLLSDGRIKAAAGDFGGAFDLFQQASRAAQEANIAVRPEGARSTRDSGESSGLPIKKSGKDSGNGWADRQGQGNQGRSGGE